jgi:hypothetical protein
MANTKLDVFNMAMYHVGTREDIASVDEQSREAEVCRLLYDRVRDHVLRSAYWDAAKGYARLALLVERDDTVAWVATDTEPGWRYAYAAPNDYLYPRFDASYQRFTPGILGSERVIFSNTEDMILFYTKQQDNVALWDANLFMAMTFALAAYATMPLNGKPQRASNAAQQANNLIIEARVLNANSEDNQIDTMPSWISARGYAGSAVDSRYFYPYGPMINIASVPAVS